MRISSFYFLISLYHPAQQIATEKSGKNPPKKSYELFWKNPIPG
jgi:hypothetical protein